MKCPTCRQAEMAETRKPHRYAESGLENVVLANVRVRDCPSCGEHLVLIPRVEELHRTIARLLLEKREQLTGHEIVFLRKWLGWSQTDFARQMHVDKSTASRWESGKQAMGEAADLLLRTYVALGKQIDDYSVDQMAERATTEATPLHARLEPDARGWHQAA
jgi:putative zinc finger/helix-turn-helix YgiT family protein